MTTYALLTAARNEAKYIEKTLQAVINQKVHPLQWIIVNDNSIDATKKIVEKYQKKYAFIKLVNLKDHKMRSFSSKVYAINTAYKMIKEDNFNFIGILDADISFESNYYEKVMQYLNENERLALAGGMRYDLIDGKFKKVITSQSSVCGAVQLYRKQIFDSIGGFTPLEYGGEDSVAEIMVRKMGYFGKSFSDIEVYHYRPTGTEKSTILKSKFREGIQLYLIGYHPLFNFFRSIVRFMERPIFWGSISYILGYLHGWMNLPRPDLPDGYLDFLHNEQRRRIKGFLTHRKDILNT